jgi:hypothetical protein
MARRVTYSAVSDDHASDSEYQLIVTGINENRCIAITEIDERAAREETPIGAF